MRRLPLLLLLLLAAAPLPATVVVGPLPLPGITVLSGSSCAPFSGCLGIERYQQLYQPVVFSALPGPESIVRIAFRSDSGAIGGSLDHIRVNLSTSPLPSLSPLFGANIGPDVVTVYDGPYGIVQSPGPFDIVMDLQVPFLYDPAVGPLLLEFLNLVAGDTASLNLDAALNPGEAVGVQRLLPTPFPSTGGASALSGTVENRGLATQFTTVAGVNGPNALPNPGTLPLMLLGLPGLLWYGRRSQNRTVSSQFACDGSGPAASRDTG